LRLLGAVAVLALGGACRVDVSVGIEADRDGTGQIQVTARLDGAAVAQLGGADPKERLRLDDLRRAGWRIDGPTEQDDGALEVTATHPFDDEADAEALLDDVGPLRGFALEQRRTFFKTTTTLEGAADLTEGLGAFTDADLEAALGATPDQPLGVSDEQLEQRFGAPIDRLLGVQVAVRLPGGIDETNAPTTTAGAGVWSPALGERIAIEAASEQWNVANVAGLAVAVASGLALLGLTVTRGNVTLGNHGTTGADEGGAPGP
jgi:hypothetical protein